MPSTNKVAAKDLLLEVMWAVIMYVVYLLYSLAFLFIFTFIMNSIINVEVETILIIGFVSAGVLSLIRLANVIFKYRCSYK